jgi:hypothetical protein
MRTFPLVLLSLAACASTSTKASHTPYPDAQTIVERVAARHRDIVRLTLHAVPSSGTQCTQVASTKPGRRGKPSDPEDLEALATGNVVVRHEPDAIDVTVPILFRDGVPAAVSGVTLRAMVPDDHEALVERAKTIAREVAAEVRKAPKPLW